MVEVVVVDNLELIKINHTALNVDSVDTHPRDVGIWSVELIAHLHCKLNKKTK